MKRLLAVLALTCTAGVARADSGMLPGGATLQFNRLFLHENNNPDQHEPLTQPDSLWRYFNFAHCECSRPGGSMIQPWHEDTFAYEILLNNPMSAQIHAPLQIWVGQSCDDTIMRPINCHQICDSTGNCAGTSDISSIQTTNGIRPEVPIYDVMEPEPSHMKDPQGFPLPCEQRQLSTAEWAVSDVNPDGSVGSTPQYFVSQGITADSQPPPLPTEFTVEGAESAIQISWKAPIGNVPDIAYYEALCSTVDGAPALAKPYAAPRYMTPRTLCGFAEDIVPAPQPTHLPVAAGAPDAGDLSVPADLQQLNPAYICKEVPDPTATSMRIEGLKNGVSYVVMFLAVDKYGNAAGTYFDQPLTPQPVTDFWEDIHQRGSKVQGGFCLIAETYGDDDPLTNTLRDFRDDTLAQTGFGRWLTDVYYATLGKLGAVVHGHPARRAVAGVLLLPLVLLALAWHYLTLPGLLALLALVWLRRRFKLRVRVPRRLAAAGTGLALALIAPARAHAQAPYWQDPLASDDKNATGTLDQQSAAEEEPLDVTWHAGLRLGPYIPQIDAGLGLTPGPYGAMFGKKSSWVPMLDVDRVIWDGYGEVTIGGTIGYLGKSAHAWVVGSDPNDPNRPRSKGDTNAFHLIPFAVTASYRYTVLDDNYGIPVVPYARAGLAYYVWWVTGPGGSFASVDGMNKARGASLGVQGSLGLSIRAERIDAEAARSMHESGIEHAGFYAEYQLAKVNGFGSSTKLNVGDSTWFAGIDFEF